MIVIILRASMEYACRWLHRVIKNLDSLRARDGRHENPKNLQHLDHSRRLLPVRTHAPAQSNVVVRVMGANITSGNNQSYLTPGLDIFEGLKPDIVAIQEFNYTSTTSNGVNTPAAFREMIDTPLGRTLSIIASRIRPTATSRTGSSAGIRFWRAVRGLTHQSPIAGSVGRKSLYRARTIFTSSACICSPPLPVARNGGREPDGADPGELSQ